jgi:uncharacterized membrane protein
MFDSMFAEPKRKTWYLLPLQVLCNLLLTWMLLSIANIVFLLPFPYRERLPEFLEIATFGLLASGMSGILYLYRRGKRLVIPSILKTPPVLIWSVVTFVLGVVLGLSIKSFPNQWSTY